MAPAKSHPAAAGRHTQFLLLLLLLHNALCASLLDVFGSSVSSLVTQQEEAPYVLLRKAQGYEVRTYPPQKWVCKAHNGTLTAAAQQTAFLALFRYLAGGNSRGVVMDMAVPASVEAPWLASETDFEACFYIGKAGQADPPTPSNALLYVRERPEITIFTRQFGGYADTEAEWRTETVSLAAVLAEAGQNVTEDRVYWNAYDSPIKFWARRNEVWLVARD